MEHQNVKPTFAMAHHEDQNSPDYEKLAKRLEQDMNLSKELIKRIVGSIQAAEQKGDISILIVRGYPCFTSSK